MTDAATLRPEQFALTGIRVLDLTWVFAGSVATRMLADQGAEVIKLESARSMDPSRGGGPWLHGVNTAPDGGGTFSALNRNKLSATLNLKTPRGQELFKQLVGISDVLLNNYRAGTMKGFNLGWDVLQKLNPRLIMCEMSGMGQTGIYTKHVTYGQTLMAIAGCYELTGDPEGGPVLPGYTYADFASPTIGAFAVASALVAREKSGDGQYIDLSQFQVTASLMAEPQFEALVNGTIHARVGNAAANTMVHNAFRCDGDDAWAVIVVRTSEEWAALRNQVPGLPKDPANAPLTQIEKEIEAWTSTRSSQAVMETLQDAGVEAARVQNARDMVDSDPHLEQREFFAWYEHLLGEQALADGVPYKMSETPGGVLRGGPAYGIHNDYVFGELLGLPQGEINALRASGVIG